MRLNDPVAIVGYVLLAIFWVVVSLLMFAARRNFRARRYVLSSFSGLAVAGLLWIGLYTGATPGSSTFTHSLETRELFGHLFYVSSPRLSYCDPGLIEVDYIEVCGISNALAQWANAPPLEFATLYPLPDAYYANDKRQTWRPTPVGGADEKYLRKVSISPSDDRPPGADDMEKAEELLHHLARQPGSYFAYYYDEDDSNQRPVTFYLLSPAERVLIRAHAY